MYRKLGVVLEIIDIIGVMEFSASGALVAIKHNLDLLGVITIGIITAVGGGMLRDIFLGLTPVSALVNPMYITVATCTSLVVFAVIFCTKKPFGSHKRIEQIYDNAMLITDTTGLAIFTIIGITTALKSCDDYNNYLLFFSGIITGVGGGIIRDIIVNRKPEIFVGSIYAGASAAGAIVFILVYRHIPFVITCILSFCITFIIRFLSAKLDWNLPKIKTSDSDL